MFGVVVSPVSSTIRDLRSASVEFASELFYVVFKRMYEAIPRYDLIPETQAEKWFKEMLIREYSRKAAAQSALAETVARALGERYWKEQRTR